MSSENLSQLPVGPQDGETSEMILLVDLSSIAHPIWHMSQAEPDPDHTSQATAAIVRSLAANHPHTAICCDSRSSFRKDADPTYKANRPAGEAPLYHQIDLAREALEADGFPVWCVDGFEGDDLIATATHKLAGGDSTVLIASADKDLLALVSDRVEVHSMRNGARIGPDEVREKLGVGPESVTDYLTLAGDSSDNIKGAKGVGPKTAAGIINIFGSVDGVYDAIDQGNATTLKPSQRAGLDELRPRLEAVREMVRMRTDVPLDIDEVFQARVPAAAETFMEDEPTPEAAEVKSLAVVPAEPPVPAPAEWERGLDPRSPDDARQVSKWLFDSRMFDSYGTPQAVLSTIMLGRDLGLPAIASLRSVHVIEGRHSLSADLMVALVLKSGLAVYFQMVESTDKICTFETQRQGAPSPQKLSYTIEQAEQAGLLKPSRSGRPTAWEKMPTQMLRARAKSEMARLEYPDLLAGTVHAGRTAGREERKLTIHTGENHETERRRTFRFPANGRRLARHDDPAVARRTGGGRNRAAAKVKPWSRLGDEHCYRRREIGRRADYRTG